MSSPSPAVPHSFHVPAYQCHLHSLWRGPHGVHLGDHLLAVLRLDVHAVARLQHHHARVELLVVSVAVHGAAVVHLDILTERRRWVRYGPRRLNRSG